MSGVFKLKNLAGTLQSQLMNGYKRLKGYMGEKKTSHPKDLATHVYAIGCDDYKNLKKSVARQRGSLTKIHRKQKKHMKIKRHATLGAKIKKE